MLAPKKRKYRKEFRGRMKGKSSRGSTIAFGEFGLKALGRGWLSARQIEAARRATTHHLKRKGRVWVRAFPDKPTTSRPAGQRMGGGKGAIDQYVAVVTPGKIILEVAGVEKELAKEALRRAGAKIGFPTRFVAQEE